MASAALFPGGDPHPCGSREGTGRQRGTTAVRPFISTIPPLLLSRPHHPSGRRLPSRDPSSSGAVRLHTSNHSTRCVGGHTRDGYIPIGGWHQNSFGPVSRIGAGTNGGGVPPTAACLVPTSSSSLFSFVARRPSPSPVVGGGCLPRPRRGTSSPARERRGGEEKWGRRSSSPALP